MAGHAALARRFDHLAERYPPREAEPAAGRLAGAGPIERVAGAGPIKHVAGAGPSRQDRTGATRVPWPTIE